MKGRRYWCGCCCRRGIAFVRASVALCLSSLFLQQPRRRAVCHLLCMADDVSNNDSDKGTVTNHIPEWLHCTLQVISVGWIHLLGSH